MNVNVKSRDIKELKKASTVRYEIETLHHTEKAENIRKTLWLWLLLLLLLLLLLWLWL